MRHCHLAALVPGQIAIIVHALLVLVVASRFCAHWLLVRR